MARRRAEGHPARLSECDAFEAAFARLMQTFSGRVIAVDERVAKLWGELRRSSDKHHWDLGVVATAIAHDMVVATRNTMDFKGRGAPIVNPFLKSPIIT